MTDTKTSSLTVSDLKKHKDIEEAAKADGKNLQTEENTTRDLYDAVRTYVSSPTGGIKDLRARVMTLITNPHAYPRYP